MSEKKPPQTVKTFIEKLSKKGNGIGFIKERSKEIEVPFTFPGDSIEAEIRKKKRDKYQGKLLNLLVPSKDRISPKCLHFGACGGCRLQHISYIKQLEVKQERVQSLFSTFLFPSDSFLPIVACDHPWNYRNKMEFTFSSDKKGESFVGLILEGSRGKVFNLTECHLVNPWFAKALNVVRNWWQKTGLTAYHPPSNQGALRTLTVREGITTGDRLIMLTVSGNADFALNKSHLESFVYELRKAVEPEDPSTYFSLFLRIQQAIKGQPTEFFEMHLFGKDHIREKMTIKNHTLDFQISPSSFFQPNTRQAEKLYSLALEMAELSGEEIVYDLYCGTGTLGIVFAKWVKQVIGVEISLESALDAKTNIKHNHLENVQIYTGSCGSVLHEIREKKSLPKPNLVLLDPPRMGLDAKSLEEVAALESPTIIYISCNPETQANDVKFFIENGYALIKLQPVDQFPHTMHIENIALLKRALHP